jgi:hypothetical protein
MLISSQIDVMTIICQIVKCAFKQTEGGTTQKGEATRSLKGSYRDETVFIDTVLIFVS